MLSTMSVSSIEQLVDGYQKTIKKVGLIAYADGAGANGALMFYPQRVRNYRDWYHVDEDIWTHYWFAMVNRGILAQPYWWDEQWTISVQHTAKDIDEHLAGVRGDCSGAGGGAGRTHGGRTARHARFLIFFLANAGWPLRRSWQRTSVLLI